MCMHRWYEITPKEMEYHVKNEGGLLVDAPNPPEASEGAEKNSVQVDSTSSDVREGIDALLSMAQGAGGAGNDAQQVEGDLDGAGEEKMPVDTAAASAGLTTTASVIAEKQSANSPTAENVTARAEDLGADKAMKEGETTKKKGEPEDEAHPEQEEEEEGELLPPKIESRFAVKAKYKIWVDPVTKKTRKLFPCEHCDSLFMALPKLITHLPTHTGVFPFLCPLCPSSFKTKNELTKHDGCKHRGGARAGFPGAQYQCQQCSVAYHTKNALQRHISNHGNDSRIPKAKYVLKRKKNRLVRSYPCPHCPAEFNKASEYEGHLVSHTGVKHYQCRLCNKKFGNECYLKKHMLRHGDARTYVCSLCGAGFKTSNGLYTHEHTVHVDTKEFVCEVCGKEFKMKWSMKEHLRVAHVDYVLPRGQTSDWQCSYCGGFLPSETLFKIHEKGHVTDKPFKCRLCPASFKYRAARISHERREHEEVVQDPRLVAPKTPTRPPQVKKPVERQEYKSSTVRHTNETTSSSQHTEEHLYYPQHVPQHPLPPAQSFMQQHFQQLQQQTLPLPHDHSREQTPIRNLPSVPVVTSHQSMLSVMTSHYSNTPTPSHTPTPSDNFHVNRGIPTTNVFSHPEQSSAPTNLQPVYSSSHILPAAAAAASVLYDSSYYMAAAAGAHLAPPPPPAHPSSLPSSLPSLSPSLTTLVQAHQLQQTDNNRATPQPSHSATPQPPHSAAPQPPHSATLQPSHSTTPRPSHSATPQPSHSTNPQPSHSATPQPSHSATPQPSHSATPQPSQSGTPQPSHVPILCSICNLTFDSQPALWNHMAVIHNLVYDIYDGSMDSSKLT